MTTFYYGGGDCNIEGNVGSLIINYRGNIIIDSKLPDNYTITLEKGQLIIDPISEAQSLNELFKYAGEFRVNSVSAKDVSGEKTYPTLTRVMDYAELIYSKAEDLTVKSEDLKVTYKQGRTFTKTRILPKRIKGGKA